MVWDERSRSSVRPPKSSNQRGEGGFFFPPYKKKEKKKGFASTRRTWSSRCSVIPIATLWSLWSWVSNGTDDTIKSRDTREPICSCWSSSTRWAFVGEKEGDSAFTLHAELPQAKDRTQTMVYLDHRPRRPRRGFRPIR